MHRTPEYLLEDEDAASRLVQETPWTTVVAVGPQGQVASRPSVLLDDDARRPSALRHLDRPDELAHDLGRRAMPAVVIGPHGSVSPSWCPPGADVPTWSHVTTHLDPTPASLDEHESWTGLRRLVDGMEGAVPEPRSLGDDRDVEHLHPDGPYAVPALAR